MVATTVGAAQIARPKFYVWMAAAFILIAFGGFIPTYWARMADGSFNGAPILHIHGALFFGWTLFFFFQTWQAASGRILDHRSWGMAGIALGTGMGFTVVLAVINSINVAETIGMADAARRFAIVSLGALTFFAVLFGAAVANNTRPDLHKRLMVLATIPMMEAALARVFMTLTAPPGAVGPPPVAAATPPGLVSLLLIGAGIVYDWRTRGRPHPAYLTVGAIFLVWMFIRQPLSETAAWMSIARAVEGLAG